MVQAVQESSVTYEELLDLEREFEDADAEIIRHQVKATKALYEKRAALVAKIPGFWPLVLEQAPPGVDEHIQPSDAALLLSALTSLEVTHFELDDPEGDPRSIAIKFTFSENEYFEDSVLEKKFWYRHADKGDWAGLVSEPVDIRWKKDQDLTQGLLAQAVKLWNGEQQKAASGGKKVEGWTDDRKALKEKIESIGLGGISFFAWFGYVGRRVSAEESKTALAEEKERRKLRQEGKEVPEDDTVEEGEDDDDEIAIEEDLEIFPEGDDLAVCISEELWPDAIKYFTNAQEQDGLSDIDFESDDEDEEGEDAAGSPPPNKKRKAALILILILCFSSTIRIPGGWACLSTMSTHAPPIRCMQIDSD
ncbi:hypothetical protein SAPIO_CDS9580 [Scedosporium apiospermum]|uniref:Nap family protein n=1 Tax=Pseudallescheria apiosperma TaxID=563466 RepID=A0A084FX34_PSEDA|nr:uncharacterized protein SAPIO_CDS9580 [Scedosporium apiospermum]KEZ39646.1 hypothetical protein SAPIO_CDS9580 [Scedosporium apiospermum]